MARVVVNWIAHSPGRAFLVVLLLGAAVWHWIGRTAYERKAGST